MSNLKTRKSMRRAMFASIAFAQFVGLAKGEVTIRLAQYMDDPYWLRFWTLIVLGAALTVVVSWVNVRIIHRLT